MSRRLAAVFAQPDDATYGVGGTLGLRADGGIAVTAILATSGDAGRIRLWPEVLGRQAFVKAWPEPGDAVLSDMFEGLPGA
ncbi:MAG TPA: hypothetical protein VGK11_00580 [Actinomycetota bacterium]